MALLIFYNVLWQHSCQSFKLNNKIVNECCCCCFCKLIAGVQVFNLTIPFFRAFVFPLVKWFPYRNLVHRFYHSTAATIRLKLKYELFGCCCLLFFQLRNETVNNWQPTTYKQCWMWAMGNKLLMYAMWNSCHSISAYVWCVLYTETHTSSNRSQWCVMCELLLTTSTQWCEHNVNTQLPATNRCLYVCAHVCEFSFSNVVGFFSFQ